MSGSPVGKKDSFSKKSNSSFAAPSAGKVEMKVVTPGFNSIPESSKKAILGDIAGRTQSILTKAGDSIPEEEAENLAWQELLAERESERGSDKPMSRRRTFEFGWIKTRAKASASSAGVARDERMSSAQSLAVDYVRGQIGSEDLQDIDDPSGRVERAEQAISNANSPSEVKDVVSEFNASIKTWNTQRSSRVLDKVRLYGIESDQEVAAAEADALAAARSSGIANAKAVASFIYAQKGSGPTWQAVFARNAADESNKSIIESYGAMPKKKSDRMTAEQKLNDERSTYATQMMPNSPERVYGTRFYYDIYVKKFDEMVDEFDKKQAQKLKDHLLMGPQLDETQEFSKVMEQERKAALDSFAAKARDEAMEDTRDATGLDTLTESDIIETGRSMGWDGDAE